MDKLVCPQCKNEEGTTSFLGYNDNDGLAEKRECDDEMCGCKYEVKYKVKEIEIKK